MRVPNYSVTFALPFQRKGATAAKPEQNNHTTMKADFKKRLIAIQKELHELIGDHTFWMEEHEDPDWEYTPAGEKAQEENGDLEYAMEYIQGVTGIEIED